MGTDKVYTTFWDFYPYYLTEHANPTNRALHFGCLGRANAVITIRRFFYNPQCQKQGSKNMGCRRQALAG